ncbi:hypothetical protein BDN71DRAFT_837961 [Pleurotus eryngii]|uniref:Uncharacterized protein n=1 Tax=Pleurotus eryngii TaxID=5323 RepID=A0A9P6A8X6_PLEER|nr:hypothetical protein BDN71DRAFT_837961 [Pleurotus eryngii]
MQNILSRKPDIYRRYRGNRSAACCPDCARRECNAHLSAVYEPARRSSVHDTRCGLPLTSPLKSILFIKPLQFHNNVHYIPLCNMFRRMLISQLHYHF